MSDTGSKGKGAAAGVERLWTVSFVLIVLISFFASMTGNGVHNGIAVLVESEGGPAMLTGAISGIFCFTALASRFVAGSLSDKRGRRFVILTGIALIFLGCIVGFFAVSLYLLIPCRMLMAVGFSMTNTAAAAAVADIVPASRVGEGLGYQSLAYALAMAVGPSVAVATGSHGRIPLFAAFGVMTVLMLVAGLLCRFRNQVMASDVPAEQRPTGIAGFFGTYIERSAFGPAIVMCIATAPMSVYMSFLSIFAVQEGISGITGYFIVGAGVMIVVRLVASKLFDRLSSNALLVPAFVAGILGFVALIAFKGTPALIAAGAFYGVSCGIAMPAIATAGMKRAPAHRFGAASATVYIGADIGIGVSAFLWGHAIDAWGFDVTFGIAAAIFVLAIVATLILLRRREPAG